VTDARVAERQLVDYLLGKLSPEAEEALEECVFPSDELHEELMSTADDLIAAYLTRTLPPGDRQRLEARFLSSPLGRERLALVSGLLAHTARRPARRGRASGSARAAAWAAGVAVAALVVWKAWPPPAREGAAPSAAHAPATAGPSGTPAPPRDRSAVPPSDTGQAGDSVALLANAPQPIRVPVAAATRTVTFEARVDEQSPTYEARLRTEDGREVWSVEGLTPRRAGAPLVVSVPASVLVSDRYVLSIAGERVRGAAPRSRMDFSLFIRRSR